ncbi:TPA: hypothetical protein DDW35_06865 [Candidatus Sumerlaeota bacterium]|nr:hypothetical protein [Candidatus Sumerlaeota bacterium]
MKKNVSRLCHAFTLIELLIVVAIISILASIALPNFMEAQVRAKVSRAASDMRSIATGLEAYMVDNNHYPFSRQINTTTHYNLVPLSARLKVITTPIAYMSSLPHDPFLPPNGWNGMTATPGPDTLTMPSIDTYDYFDAEADLDEDMKPNASGVITGTDSTRGCKWRLASFGPDTWGCFGIIWGSKLSAGDREGVDYDATNGTASNGDIVRTGAKVRDWTMEGALAK